MKYPWLTKLIALGGVVLLLLIGLSLISDTLRDRQRYRNAAAHSVARSLAGPQTLIGPLIHRDCVESWDVTTGSGRERRTEEQRREVVLTAMPEQLNVKADATMGERARGLHTVSTYTLAPEIEAHFGPLAQLQPRTTVKGSRMQCGAPMLMLAVGDARGIRSAKLTLGGQELPLLPGTFYSAYNRGLHAVLPESVRDEVDGVTVFLSLELVGTTSLSIVPLGGQTQVQLHSAWPHPSFGGRFLPSERTVEASGFDAQWRLSSLATTAQQDIVDGKPVCDAQAPSADDMAPLDNAAGAGGCADSFSVAFIDPVNPYSLVDRATKYGVLFIALTFVAVGLFELMKRLRVHPVQYLLVGSALCSFFLLLLSLSEHLAFGLAYALAAAACVLLLAYYASHMLGSARRGLPFGAAMALLYGLLYVLLQLEQTALVVGSVALFAVLAVVMVLTRKVNWYGLTPARSGAPTAAVTPATVTSKP